MQSEEDRTVAKISYEKPTAVDLGPTALIVGASCAIGDVIAQDVCNRTGNSAAAHCHNLGSGATLDCGTGDAAGTLRNPGSSY